MSEHMHFFDCPAGPSALVLPFPLRERLAEWQQLRSVMIRQCPEPFAREEWGYLIAFLDPANLELPMTRAFGLPLGGNKHACQALFRPRGSVAVWLPNNVSLLGPLMLILLSLSGNRLRFKAGFQGDDLAAVFLEFARGKLQPGQLRDDLHDRVLLERFDREDPRNREMASDAAVRIVFGSDEAARAIAFLPHPVGSSIFTFADRRSVAWLEAQQLNDATLVTLIKVFTIYGQVGCTSPSQVILLDGSAEHALKTRDRLLELWPMVVRRRVPMHVASENTMARQHAAAVGWDAVLAPQNGATLVAGDLSLPPTIGRMTLPIVPADVRQAVENLPANIQTIGHALRDSRDTDWLRILGRTCVKRFVPLARMHHFGSIWDGWDFWRSLFEVVEVSE